MEEKVNGEAQVKERGNCERDESGEEGTKVDPEKWRGTRAKRAGREKGEAESSH